MWVFSRLRELRSILFFLVFLCYGICNGDIQIGMDRNCLLVKERITMTLHAYKLQPNNGIELEYTRPNGIDFRICIGYLLVSRLTVVMTSKM